MKNQSIFFPTAMLLFAALFLFPFASRAERQTGKSMPGPATAVLYPFADLGSLSTLPDGAVKETCSHASPAGNTTATAPYSGEAELSEIVLQELQKHLSQKMSVRIAQPNEQVAPASIIFTGCFTRIDPGNARARLAGMGLGASHITAHIRIYSVTTNGTAPLEEYEVSVKGSKALPPLGPAGLALNAVSERRETLQADAKRLAREILKRMKQNENQTAKN